MKKFIFTLIFSLTIPAIVSAQSATATVAESGDTSINVSSVETQLKGILATAFNTIDPWRQKQAKYFSELRDKKKIELGINTAKDVYDALTPTAPEAPAIPGQQQEQNLSDLPNQYEGVDFGAYAVLIYATALAAIFTSIALFYITLVLLALLVLRFIIRLFR